MYRFIPAVAEHASLIVSNLNQDIEGEMKAISPKPVDEFIADAIHRSDDVWSAFDEEGIICIFGIRRPHLLSDRGVPWLITSNLIHKHKRDFLKGAKITLAHWLTQYDVLENWIPMGFPRLLRWLEWAGFTVFDAEPYGVKRQFFYRIEKRKT